MKSVTRIHGLIIIVFGLVGLLLIPYYKYHINPDGVAYLSIAKKYAQGDWYYAINAVWSPLISWLASLFIYVGIEPLTSAKLILIFAGMAALWGFKLLLGRMRVPDADQTFLLLLAFPNVLFMAFAYVTPDLLLIVCLLFYLCSISHERYLLSPAHFFFSGLWGAWAYLSKAFGFFFFIAHFTISHVYFYFIEKQNRAKVIRFYALGLGIFLILCSIWAFMLYTKYGNLSIGRVGSYILTNQVSPHPEDSPGLTKGFFAPPDKKALGVIEQPAEYLKNSWHPFKSWDDFCYELGYIVKNIYCTAKVTLGIFDPTYSIFNPIIFISLTCFFIVSMSHFAGFLHNKIHFLFLSTIIIMSLGYSMILVRERYLWMLYFMGLACIGVLGTSYKQKRTLVGWRRSLIMLILILIFYFNPIRHFIGDYRKGQDVYQLAMKLKERYNLHGGLASNAERIPTTFLAFYLDARYFGEMRHDLDFNIQLEQLHRMNVDYFIVYKQKGDCCNTLADFREITGGEIPALRIYSLKEPVKYKIE